jgi:hypothetical protein
MQEPASSSSTNVQPNRSNTANNNSSSGNASGSSAPRKKKEVIHPGQGQMQLLIHQHLPDGTKDGTTSAATGSLGGGSGNTAKRQKHDGDDGQVCLGCGATSTPEWRRGPMGEDMIFYQCFRTLH